MPARPARHRLLSGSCPSAHGFAPRFLPTLGHPHAVALHFVRCGQLTGGLSPPRLRPCWAHIKKGDRVASVSFIARFPVRELILQPEQQEQRQEQLRQQPEQRQEQPARQERQEQRREQRQELPASALRPELQEPSERSQQKKQSSRGRVQRKVFSWFQCIWVFEK